MGACSLYFALDYRLPPWRYQVHFVQQARINTPSKTKRYTNNTHKKMSNGNILRDAVNLGNQTGGTHVQQPKSEKPKIEFHYAKPNTANKGRVIKPLDQCQNNHPIKWNSDVRNYSRP